MTVTPVTGLQNSTITAFNTISTTVQDVVAQNGTRSQITFHNPGSVDIVVFPKTAFVGLPQPGGASTTLGPTTATLGGGFRIFANGGDRVITGQAAKQQWQALSVSGVQNPLTIMEQT